MSMLRVIFRRRNERRRVAQTLLGAYEVTSCVVVRLSLNVRFR